MQGLLPEPGFGHAASNIETSSSFFLLFFFSSFIRNWCSPTARDGDFRHDFAVRSADSDFVSGGRLKSVAPV